MGTFSRTPLALGALVLVLCAFVATTFDGPEWVGPELDRSEQTIANDREDGRNDAEQASPEERSADDSDDPSLPWLPPLDLVLLIPTTLIFALAVLVFAQLRVVRRRRQLTRRIGVRGGAVPEPVAEAEDEEDAGLPGALGRGVRAIDAGTPRNAIVAAWVRLEHGVESERFPHRPEETPTEFVERALASYRLEPEAIRRLAVLYREARFSKHPVTEEHRAEARICLDRLLGSLDGRAAR